MATGDPIDPQVLDFLDQHIRSIEQLEILLLLLAHSDRIWTARDVSVELRGNESSTASRLDELARDGLIQRWDQPTCEYRYERSPALDALMGRVADCYSRFRLRMIERIFKK